MMPTLSHWWQQRLLLWSTNQSHQRWHHVNSYISVAARTLTHWGRVTHICISKITIIGSDNGLSPGRCQAVISTNAGILLIWPLGTNFNEMFIEILIFSFMKMRLKVSSAKWRPFGLSLNVSMSNNLLVLKLITVISPVFADNIHLHLQNVGHGIWLSFSSIVPSFALRMKQCKKKVVWKLLKPYQWRICMHIF